MPEYQGQTDQLNQIELPSAIHHVIWGCPKAVAGGKAGLDVFTHYVGNGSELEIEFKDNAAKSHGKFKDKIYGDHFWASVTVPDNAKDALYATVKLKKHSLEKESGPLLVLPPIQITNAKWDKQEARRGDILKLTADIKEVPDGTEAEIEIWEHDADEAHDLITKFPVLVEGGKVEAEWEFEYHEDTDEIPTEEESERGYNPPEYFFRVKVEEVFADSELLEFKDWIEIELKEEDGNCIKNENYILYLPDGTQRSGNLNIDGYAKEENIPPGKINIEFPNLEGVDFKLE